MSVRKNVTEPFKFFDAADMSGNLTSIVSDVSHLDNMGVALVWTGTPVGTFSFEAQVGVSPWQDIGLTGITTTGAAGEHVVNLNQLPFNRIRIVYTATSGTGSLTAYGVVKMV